jgi:hypothetical protein
MFDSFTLIGSFDEILAQFPIQYEESLPAGDNYLFEWRTLYEKNLQRFGERQYLYKVMGQELSSCIDRMASNVIESVKVSHVNLSQLKQFCDQWNPGSQPKPSKAPKAAVARCIRRMISSLLLPELEVVYTCKQPVYVGLNNSDPIQYVKAKPGQVTVQASHPQYWPLYLIEKAYYCCEPVSRLLTAAICARFCIGGNTDDENTIIACKEQLLVLQVANKALDPLISSLFKY